MGVGSGRNVAPFRAACCAVDAIDDDAVRAREAASRFANDARVYVRCASYHGPFADASDALANARAYDAALSTHALLHGAERTIAATLGALRDALAPAAPLYATFGSTNDSRFGTGRRIADATFAPQTGSEAGVAHTYFDERRLREILHDFTIESLAEVAARDHVGTWAHDAAEAATIVHWFVRATARPR
ncbi:MAG: hypothetical protein NVS2B8_17980 [Vulcanimicrobiaceae bacterium]